MNPEVKELWLEALRSGEYEQGTRYLNSDGKFCCLGVLCEVALRVNPLLVKVEVRQDSYFSITEYDDRKGFLPASVKEWAGLDSNNPRVLDGRLSELNDGGTSFQVIADLIENNL